MYVNKPNLIVPFHPCNLLETCKALGHSSCGVLSKEKARKVLSMRKLIELGISEIPEDPVNSTPDVSYFLFFSGPSVRDSMCNMVIFF